jgi:ADP-heptose:LPS heptosyltransferase
MKFNTLKTLRSLDFWLFYLFSPFFIALILTSKCASLFFKQSKLQINSFSTVSFFKFLGGGSLFILFPLAYSLKKTYPAIKIRLYAGKSIRKFAEATGIFDEIVFIDSIKFVPWALKKFAINEKELIMNLESNSLISSIITYSLIPKRSITFGNNHNKIIKLFYSDMVFYSPSKNIQNAYEMLFKFYGVNQIPRVKITHALTERAKNLFTKKNKKLDFELKNCIAISPFSSSLSKEREPSFSELSEFLIDKKGLVTKSLDSQNKVIVLLGGVEDISSADMLKNDILKLSTQFQIFNVCGKFDLLESAYIASQSELFITVDSGLNHIVRLMNPRKIISFFGPTSPYTQLGNIIKPTNEVVLYNDFYCSPCVHISSSSPCNGEAPCMRSLFHKDIIKKESNIPYLFL